MTKNYPDPHMTYKIEKICHNCGIRGHVLKECPKPKIVCYHCGEPGHMKNNFLKPQLTRGSIAGVIEPIMGLSSTQTIPPNPNGERNVGAFQGKCNKCGVLGHKKSCCPEHQEDYGTSVGRDITSKKSP